MNQPLPGNKSRKLKFDGESCIVCGSLHIYRTGRTQTKSCYTINHHEEYVCKNCGNNFWTPLPQVFLGGCNQLPKIELFDEDKILKGPYLPHRHEYFWLVVFERDLIKECELKPKYIAVKTRGSILMLKPEQARLLAKQMNEMVDYWEAH